MNPIFSSLKILLVASVLILSSVGALAQPKAQRFALADSLIKAKEYAQALGLLNTLVDEDILNTEYLNKRANALMGLNRLEEGYYDIQRAMEIDPKCLECRINLGLLAAQQKEYGKAQSYLDTVIRTDQKNHKAYYMRANIRALTGQRTGALNDFDRAIAYDNENAEYWAARGQYNMQLGFFEFGVKDLNAALALDSNNYVAQYTYARFHSSNGNWESALQKFDKCIALDPENADLYSSIGSVYEYMEEHQKAYEAYNVAIGKDTANPMYHINRAISQHSLENIEGVCEDYSRALVLFERDPSLYAEQIDGLKVSIEEYCDEDGKGYYYHRGIAAFNLQEYEKDIAFLDAGLKKHPNSYMMRLFRANALMKLNRNEEAIEGYNFILEHEKDLIEEINGLSAKPLNDLYLTILFAELRNNLGLTYAQKGDYLAGLEQLDKAELSMKESITVKEIRESLSFGYTVRGMIYNAQGQSEAANEALKKAMVYIDEKPSAALLFHKAIAYLGLGTEESLALLYFSFDNGKFGLSSQFEAPSKLKVTETNMLKSALDELNKAIALDPEFAEAYLLRASIKKNLEMPDFCKDVLIAENLGIENAAQQLQVKCSASKGAKAKKKETKKKKKEAQKRDKTEEQLRKSGGFY